MKLEVIDIVDYNIEIQNDISQDKYYLTLYLNIPPLKKFFERTSNIAFANI